MLQNQSLLASHLSRNHEVQQYAETLEEKTVMLLKRMLSKVDQAGVEGMTSFLTDLKTKRNALSTLIQCPESYLIIVSLIKISPYYHNKGLITASWLTTHLLGVYGGVSHIFGSFARKTFM
jgi:hypothetical protein